MAHHVRRPGILPVLSGMLVLGAIVTGAYVGDVLSHPPPADGSFGYNTFVPPNTPAASYVDPVFGSTVIRLTTDHLLDDIYARNMLWNADATKFFHYGNVVDTTTGAVTHTGIPSGSNQTDRGFDPSNPNVLYYSSGSALHSVTLGQGGAKTDVVYFTAPSTILGLGGTINWMDSTGRYMLVRYGPEPSVYVYDRQNLAAGPYANPVDGSSVEADNGYVGLTPDGTYIVSGHNSWKIDHVNRAVSGTSNYYWDLCGDHGSFISASDGHNYKLTSNCKDANELWRVDITNNAQGLTWAAEKVLPHNMRLLALPSWSFAQHTSAVARGPFRDWGFFSIEDITDNFNGPVTGWLPYKSEIIAVNAVTGEIRRLAHHRSRSLQDSYYYYPRLSASWAGEFVAWASNYNQPNVVDIFETPFSTVQPGAPTPPTNLRILP